MKVRIECYVKTLLVNLPNVKTTVTTGPLLLGQLEPSTIFTKCPSFVTTSNTPPATKPRKCSTCGEDTSRCPLQYLEECGFHLRTLLYSPTFTLCLLDQQEMARLGQCEKLKEFLLNCPTFPLVEAWKRHLACGDS